MNERTARLTEEREAEARALIERGEWFAVYPARRAAELLAEVDSLRTVEEALRVKLGRIENVLLGASLAGHVHHDVVDKVQEILAPAKEP